MQLYSFVLSFIIIAPFLSLLHLADSLGGQVFLSLSTDTQATSSEPQVSSPRYDFGSISQSWDYAHFIPLTNSPGNQVKLVLNYSVNYPSIVGEPINAIMEVYSATNLSLIRTSSFPIAIVANQTGTIQLATTFTDNSLTEVIATAKFTDPEEIVMLSDPVQLNIRLGTTLRPSPASI